MLNSRQTTIGLVIFLSVGMTLLMSLPYTPSEAAPAEPAAPTPTPAPPGAENVTLMGHTGGQAGAVYAQDGYIYAGFGLELAILDTSTPTQPLRTGYVMLMTGDMPPGYPAAKPTSTPSIIVTVVTAVVASPTPTPSVVEVTANAVVKVSPTPAATPSTARQPNEPNAPEGGGSSSSFINDVLIAGNYAYAVTKDGLWIVDVADPAAPVKTGFYRTPSGSEALGVAVSGDYAYLAAGNDGLRILDVSNPADPTYASFYFTQQSTLDVAVSGDHAYVVDGAALYVVNVSDPRFPVGVGFYDEASGVRDVVVSNTLAYVAAADGLRVLDVSDPQNPRDIGAYNTTYYISQVAVSGDYAYLLEAYGYLRIVDISDPANPVEVGAYTPLGRAQKMSVSGDYVYLSDYNMNIHIVDVSNPAVPVEAGHYRTLYYARDVALSLTGDYAYVIDNYTLYTLDISDDARPMRLNSSVLPGPLQKITTAGNYVYAIDGNDGLRIVDVSNPADPVEVGAYDPPRYVYDVAVAGDYAYIASGTSGLWVVDVSDPANPLELGSNTSIYANNIDIAGDYAYVLDNLGGDLWVVDISNPAAPTEVGYYHFGWGQNFFGIAAANNYVYVIASGGMLWVLDVSNPGSPTYVSAYQSSKYAYFRDLAVTNNYAYIAVWNGLGDIRQANAPDAAPLSAPAGSPNRRLGEDERGGASYYDGGLLVIDISDPTAPTQAGYFSASGNGAGVAADGDKVYLVDAITGFFGLRKISGITGKATDINGTPFPGVTIEASSGLSATTRWQSGAYTINPPVDGTYALTPTLSGYTFSPTARSVAIPPDARNQDFTILAAPVSITLQPGVAAELVYTDTQGLPTRLSFPADAVSQTITLILTPTLATAGRRMLFAGHAFDLSATLKTGLAAYQSGGQGSVLLPNFAFNRPVTVTLAYSYWDINEAGDENKLGLWRRDSVQWLNAAEDCGSSSSFAYTRDTNNNTLEISICKSGSYGLFGVTSIEGAVTIASVRDSADGTSSAALQKADDMSMTVLVPLGWDTLEVRNGEYEWNQLDDILQQASRHGLMVILRVYNAPVWHTPFGAPLTHPPTDPQALYNFMNKMVAHLEESGDADRVGGYVIWNEPNIPAQWGEQPADPAVYLALLQAAYQGAKAADPGAVIVSAPLAPTETGNGAINDLDYLAQLYDLGLSDYVDAVGMNGLGFQHDPDYDPGYPDYSFTRLKYQRDVMVSKGDLTHPVWALEVGWLRDSPYDMGDFEAFKVSEQQQAQYLHRAWQKAETEWNWLDVISFWNMDFKRYYPPESNFHWYSIADTLAELYLTPPGPVSIYLTPGAETGLGYTDPRGVTRQLKFPANAVSQPTTMLLAPTQASVGLGYLTVGNSFELKAYRAGSLQMDMPFAETPLTYDYGYYGYGGDFDKHVAAVTDENLLTLWYWNGAAWQDAAETCDPPSDYIRHTDHNRLEVNICRAGEFVLVGPTNQVYLPLILKEAPSPQA